MFYHFSIGRCTDKNWTKKTPCWNYTLRSTLWVTMERTKKYTKLEIVRWRFEIIQIFKAIQLALFKPLTVNLLLQILVSCFSSVQFFTCFFTRPKTGSPMNQLLGECKKKVSALVEILKARRLYLQCWLPASLPIFHYRFVIVSVANIMASLSSVELLKLEPR